MPLRFKLHRRIGFMRAIINHYNVQGCEELEIDCLNIFVIVRVIRAANTHAAVFRCCGRRIGKVAVCARCRITVMIRSRVKRGLVEIKGSTCHVSNKGIGFRIRRGTLIDADIAQIAFDFCICCPAGATNVVFVIGVHFVKETTHIIDLVVQIAVLINRCFFHAVHIEHNTRILINGNNDVILFAEHRGHAIRISFDCFRSAAVYPGDNR